MKTKFKSLIEKILQDSEVAPSGAMSADIMEPFKEAPIKKYKKIKKKNKKGKEENLDEQFEFFSNLLTLVEATRKSFDPNEHIQTPGKEKVSIVVGRFSPFHLGHLALIKAAKHPVVIFIVKGVKSSLDKHKNPFPAEVQKEIMEKAFKGINMQKVKDIKIIDSANLVEMMDVLRKENMEPVELICGTDRYKMYKAMADKYPPMLNGNVKVIEVKRNENSKNEIETYSGTKVRQALLDGDLELASKMIGIPDLKYLEKLRRFL